MNPLLIVTYLFNILIVNYVYGIFGILISLAGSAALAYFISKDGGPKRHHWAQIAAVAFGHVAGFVAIAYAPWGSPMITGIAFIMELFIVAIFSFMGR